MQRRRFAIRKARMALTADRGRAPGERELADAVGITVAQLREALRVSQPIAHLEAPLGTDDADGDSIMFLIPDEREERPDEHLSRSDDFRQLGALLNALPPREAVILRARFGLDEDPNASDPPSPRTLQEVGQTLCLSRERVRQLQKQALGRLREQLEAIAFEEAHHEEMAIPA
jgi:RNA polymerase primary sigma factor